MNSVLSSLRCSLAARCPVRWRPASSGARPALPVARPALALPSALSFSTGAPSHSNKGIWEEDWKPSKKPREEDEEALGDGWEEGEEGEGWFRGEEEEQEEVDPEDDETYDENAPVRPRREIVQKPYDVPFVVETLRAAKASDVCVINLEHKVDWVKTMVHATGRSRAHVRSMANALLEELKRRRPGRAWRLDQKDCEFWVIVNSGDILVNLWTEEERAEYDLERTWILRRNERNPFAASFDEEAETAWIYDEDDAAEEEYDPDVEKIKGFKNYK